MNKETNYLFTIVGGLTLCISLILFTFVSEREPDSLSFYATVKEVYEGSAIIVPFNDAPLNYPELSGNITNVQIGDVIKVTCEPLIRETYPAMITVLNYKIVATTSQGTTTTQYQFAPWEN